MKCVIILTICIFGFCAAEFCRDDQVRQDCVDTACDTNSHVSCHSGICTCEQSQDHSCRSSSDCYKDGSSACKFQFGSYQRTGHWHCSSSRHRCYCLPGQN